MKRYGNLDVLKMELKEGLNIILIAMKGDLRDKLFQMFVVERLLMDEPMSFEEYFDRNTTHSKKSKENTKDVLKKVNIILKKVLNKGVDNHGDI